MLLQSGALIKKNFVLLEVIQRRATNFNLGDFHPTTNITFSLKKIPLMMALELGDVLFFLKSLKKIKNI